jgi:hypothetical protein
VSSLRSYSPVPYTLLLVKPDRSCNESRQGRRGHCKALRREVIPEEVEAALDPPDEDLVGMPETSEHLIENAHRGAAATAAKRPVSAIEQALAAVPQERIHIPELLRLRGELRVAAGADVTTVEESFTEAIVLAREIGTKLVELRATTSLARFLARHGRADEARARLAPLYAWFTEGFDAPDLVQAKALLDETAQGLK